MSREDEYVSDKDEEDIDEDIDEDDKDEDEHLSDNDVTPSNSPEPKRQKEVADTASPNLFTAPTNDSDTHENHQPDERSLFPAPPRRWIAHKPKSSKHTSETRVMTRNQLQRSFSLSFLSSLSPDWPANARHNFGKTTSRHDLHRLSDKKTDKGDEKTNLTN